MSTSRGPNEPGGRPSGLRGRLGPPLTRRGFVSLGAQALILIGLGGLLRGLAGRSWFIRPPGARPENRFLSLCIKCQKCREVCPTSVIAPVLAVEDPAGAGTPRLDFRFGYCNLCLKCVDVCPTGVLQPVAKEAAKMGIAEIDKERCVAWAWKGCTECSEKCPYDAISLDGSRRPIVDAGKCNGCGLCEYVCPSSSLRAYTRAKGKGIVVIPESAARAAES